jgi:hypothetical protein
MVHDDDGYCIRQYFCQCCGQPEILAEIAIASHGKVIEIVDWPPSR